MKRPAPQFPIDTTVARRLDALEQLINRKYEGKPSVLEERTGLKMAQVSQWFTGYRALRDKALRRLEALTYMPEGWFDAGEMAIFTLDRPESKVNASSPAQIPSLPENDAISIPQYNAGGAMGHGYALEEKQPGLIKSWSVDHEWLRLNVKHHTGVQNLCIVTGFGPSMQPKYNPGDPLLLDSGVKVVEAEGIYFFRVAGHGYIKQLQRIPTEVGLIIRAKSLNKDYDPFDITGKMDFEVFGKVLTVWRSEQV